MHASCRHRTLAQNDVAGIQQCLDCGTLSVHLGATTIRLDASAAEGLWAALAEALHELHADVSRRPVVRAVGSA